MMHFEPVGKKNSHHFKPQLPSLGDEIENTVLSRTDGATKFIVIGSAWIQAFISNSWVFAVPQEKIKSYFSQVEGLFLNKDFCTDFGATHFVTKMQDLASKNFSSPIVECFCNGQGESNKIVGVSEFGKKIPKKDLNDICGIPSVVKIDGTSYVTDGHFLVSESKKPVVRVSFCLNEKLNRSHYRSALLNDILKMG